jgi:hypothetical protein
LLSLSCEGRPGKARQIYSAPSRELNQDFWLTKLEYGCIILEARVIDWKVIGVTAEERNHILSFQPNIQSDYMKYHA